MFSVVLVHPEIPPNTGNVIRLCANTGVALHLVEPLGFRIDDRELKRAGLDYWEHLHVAMYPSLDAFLEATATQRRWFFSTRAKTPYADALFERGDMLVFGRETKGLPESLLAENSDNCLTIPMQGMRSLNLATAVGIVLFEAVRQQSVA